MSTIRDWLSSNEQDFTDLCNKWNVFCQDKEKVEQYGLNVPESLALSAKISSYLECRTTYKRVNSSVNRMAKDAAKKEATAAIRQFANSNIRYNNNIDEPTRRMLGIRVRDTSLTVHQRPTNRPETIVENTKNRLEHNIKAISNEMRGTSKPADAHGVRFAWQIGGERPASAEDLPKSKFSRRTSLLMTYSEADKGKQVFYATCYENTKGEAGPWSMLAEAYIG